MTTTERPHRPYSFFRSGPRSSLLQFRVLLIVVVAALDNADKQLLASSFPLLEKTLHMNVATLGYFSLVTNASYALALPFWAWLLHKFTLRHIHTLLAVACATWGIATLGIAASAASFAWQASCRALTGAALASILPLSQTLLVECIPNPSERGQAFGLLSLCETFAGTLASASVVYWDTSWQYPYVVLGVLSLFMSILVHQHLPMEHTSTFGATNASFLQTARRVIQNPSFACLVGQGVAGGVPWGSMSFLLLLWGWKGFTNSQVAALQLYAGASATLGGAIGGLLGDSLSARPRGRIWVALASVLGGIPLYGCFFVFLRIHLELCLCHCLSSSGDVDDCWSESTAVCRLGTKWYRTCPSDCIVDLVGKAVGITLWCTPGRILDATRIPSGA